MKLRMVDLADDSKDAIASGKKELGLDPNVKGNAEIVRANSTKNSVTETALGLIPATGISVKGLELTDADAERIHRKACYDQKLGEAVDQHPKESGSGGRKANVV